MSETTTPAEPVATPREPTPLMSRRGELLKLVIQRADQIAATARARLESSSAAAAARAQGLRKNASAILANALERIGPARLTVPTMLRRAAHDQLERAAGALQGLANRIQPARQAPQETPPADRAA